MKALKIVGIALGVLVLLAVGGLAYVVYKARHLEDSHDLQAQVDEVARRAVAEGIIAPEDNLLLPRFYMAPGLEDPIRTMIGRWRSTRPNWIA